MNCTALLTRALSSALFLACVQASGQPAEDCAANVASLLKANADMRDRVFRSPAHSHAKAQALAELKRSDALLARVCPIRTQQDADLRIEAAIARMNAEDLLKRGKPSGGAL